MERHADGNPSQPELITDALGENFGLAKVVEDSPVLSEGVERIAHFQPQIDPLLEGFTTLRKMREGSERLRKAGDRFPVGGACGRLRAGLTEVADGLAPHRAAEGMVGETIEVFDQPVGVQLFDRRHDARVKGAPSVLEEARIRDLVDRRRALPARIMTAIEQLYANRL